MCVRKRDALPLALLSCWITLKIFLFSPILIYITNAEEIRISLTTLLILYAIPCLILGIIFIGLGFVLSQIMRRLYITILFSVSILFWLQSDILLWNYGRIDGTFFDWSQYVWRGYIDSALWITILVLFIFSQKKIGEFIVSGVIFLFIIQIITLFSIERKNVFNKNIDDNVSSKIAFDRMPQFSTKENVIHIVLDGFQSDIFEELVLNSDIADYRDNFEGFTFFKEATTSTAITYLSVPSFLTSRTYRNHIPVWSFKDQALQGKNIVSVLADSGYEIDIASGTDFSLNSDASAIYYRIPHPFQGKKKMEVFQAVYLLDLSLFRVLPHFVKRVIYNRQAWLLSSWFFQEDGLQFAHFSDNAFLETITKELSIGRPTPVYKYIHLLTPHPPIVVGKDYRPSKRPLEYNRENFKRQSYYSLQRILQFLKKLRVMSIYDTSTIIIQSDHGGGVPFKMTSSNSGTSIDSTESKFDIWGSVLPLLLIKPSTSTAPLSVSQAPVELNDLPATIVALLRLSENFEGRNVFAMKPEDKRERRYYHELSHRNDASKVGYFEALQEYIIQGSVFLESSWRQGALYVRPSQHGYAWGSLLTFGKNGTVLPYLHGGWSSPDETVTWTGAEEAELKLRVPSPHTGTVSLTAKLSPFIIRNKLPSQPVVIRINGKYLGEWVLTEPVMQTHAMAIPSGLLQDKEIVLSFAFPSAAVPESLGVSADHRTLAALFHSINLADDSGQATR